MGFEYSKHPPLTRRARRAWEEKLEPTRWKAACRSTMAPTNDRNNLSNAKDGCGTKTEDRTNTEL